jgi:hypothetical protein
MLYLLKSPALFVQVTSRSLAEEKGDGVVCGMEDTRGGQEGRWSQATLAVGARKRAAPLLEASTLRHVEPQTHRGPPSDSLIIDACSLSQASTGPADAGLRQGALQLATAFPRPVWLDHLLPPLEAHEAVPLRATRRAIRAIVADLPADLGARPVKHLKPMLTCFPKAKTVHLHDIGFLDPGQQDSLIAWLGERGHSLTRVQRMPISVEAFHRRAWAAGVFRSVKSVSLFLPKRGDMDLLLAGAVRGVETICVGLSREPPKVERDALKLLRTFPALKELSYFTDPGAGDVHLPPFIPPTLEALSLSLLTAKPVRLLGSLPPMIESSGARLRSLKLDLEELEDPAVARGVRSLFQGSASTLEEVKLVVRGATFESAVELAEVLASCQHLARLEAPINTFAVLPRGGHVTLSRLAHLRLSYSGGVGAGDDDSDDDSDDEGSLSSPAMWGLMARGGLPSLSSLSLDSYQWGRWKGKAMVPAFEAVAGTLKELRLTRWSFKHATEEDDSDEMLRQLGEAIGRLRRLETLELDIRGCGHPYHLIGQGMAEGSNPALRSLTFSLDGGAAWLACRPSIILPSVQTVHVSTDGIGSERLALALALLSLGYRGILVMKDPYIKGGMQDHMRAILPPHVHVRFFKPSGGDPRLA